MRAWLQRNIGPKTIQVHLLSGHDYLGSGPSSAVPIAEPGVADRQCAIVREGRAFVLRDLRADRKGTLVNYRIVRSVVLVPGDQVQIGRTVLRFQQLETSAAGGARGEARVVPLPLELTTVRRASSGRRDPCP